MGKVGAGVALLHGCPQSCMPNPVKGILEVYEGMVEILLVLERIRRLKILSMVLLPALKPACSWIRTQNFQLKLSNTVVTLK